MLNVSPSVIWERSRTHLLLLKLPMTTFSMFSKNWKIFPRFRKIGKFCPCFRKRWKFCPCFRKRGKFGPCFRIWHRGNTKSRTRKIWKKISELSEFSELSAFSPWPKHLRLPRSSSFKIKIAGSNFAESGEENTLTAWRRVKCARGTCTFQKWFKILAQGMKIARNLLKMIAAAYPKQWELRVSESYYLFSKLFSTSVFWKSR